MAQDDTFVIGVRPADAGDAEAIRAVRAAVAASARRHRGGDVVAATIDSEDGTVPVDELPADDGLHLVGTIGQVVVAALTAEIVPAVEGGATCRLTFIGVEPAARGVGLGALLIRSVREWATARHAVSLDAAALPGDRSTKNFFEAHGLVSRLIVVRSPLP